MKDFSERPGACGACVELCHPTGYLGVPSVFDPGILVETRDEEFSEPSADVGR